MAMIAPLCNNNVMPTAYAEVVRLERAQWESEVSKFSDYNYRQNWAYGLALAKKRGATSEHVAIRHDGIVGLADVRIKKIPILGAGLAYINGGPLVRRRDDPDGDIERLDLCLDALVREYVQQRGLTLRVIAPIGDAAQNQAIAEAFERAGFHASDRGDRYRTVMVALDRPLEQVRSSFHSHWRRDLTVAERSNLDVSFDTGTDRFEQVAQMLEGLRAKKGFELDLDTNFFADIQQHLEGHDRLVVGLVLQNGVPIAGNITAVHGDTAVYLIGASTDAARDCKASYLMHWRTIELIHARGIKWYDLGEIDPVSNPGVTFFKLRTNGIDVSAAGPFEMPPGGVRGRMADWAERAYRRAKGTK